LVLAPRGVLIDLLRQMESEPEQAKIRYLLALLLLRRRFVRLVDTEAASGGAVGAEAAGGRISGGEEAGAAVLPMMRLEVAEDGSTVDVLVCDISRSESETLSESLSELLYCEASEIDQEG
jgi:hypothetical protein